MAVGLGRPDADALLFGQVDGSPMRPNQLRIYGHLFKRDDTAAACAIEAAMRSRNEPSGPQSPRFGANLGPIPHRSANLGELSR